MYSFIQTVAQPAFKSLGFSWGTKHNKTLTLWLQYADDAAVLWSDLKSMQQLLGLYKTWYSWTEMTMRLDKFVRFGMQMRCGVYT